MSDSAVPMTTSAALRSMSWTQYLVFLVAYLSWASAMFDMAVIPLALPSIAKEFQVPPSSVAIGITVTMIMRSIGAIFWGRISDMYGRKKPLLIVLFGFTLVSMATGLANNLASFIVIRAAFGFIMGGEWGLGTAISLETVPVETRGFFSGTLQSGLHLGFLLASLTLRAISAYPGKYTWRTLMFLSGIPSSISFLLCLIIPESPVWLETQRLKKIAAAQNPTGQESTNAVLVKKYWNSFWILRVLYLIFLIAPKTAVFNISYNMLPTTFINQHGLAQTEVSNIVICQSIGAIIGGSLIGYFAQIYLSRKTTMILGLLAVATVIYPFFLSQDRTVLFMCAVLVQFINAGGQGPIPAHLTELSPPELRGTIPGLAYNMGQAIMAPLIQIITLISEKLPKVKEHGEDVTNYGLVSVIATALAIVWTLIMLIFGPENKGASLMEDVVEDEDEEEVYSGLKKVLI